MKAYLNAHARAVFILVALAAFAAALIRPAWLEGAASDAMFVTGIALVARGIVIDCALGRRGRHLRPDFFEDGS